MISIIGSGKVGTAIAFLCVSNSLDNVLLVNRTKSKAIGEALDIANAIPDTSKFSIHGTNDYSKIVGFIKILTRGNIVQHQETDI